MATNTNTQTTRPTTSTSRDAGRLERLSAGVRELLATIEDGRQTRIAVQGRGRWRVDADTPTCKSFSSPAYGGVEVTIESASLAAGWQVSVRRNGTVETLFDSPVGRKTAFEKAEEWLGKLADEYADAEKIALSADECAEAAGISGFTDEFTGGE